MTRVSVRSDAVDVALQGVVAALVYVALTGLFLVPTPQRLAHHLPADLGDPVLLTYLLAWGARSIAAGLDGFFDANFYYPASQVLALSDHMIGPAAQTLLLLRLGAPSVVYAYNLLFLTSFVLSGLATFWVLRRGVGTSFVAALLGGALFAFSPYRFGQLSHLHVLLAQWIPLALWFFYRLLRYRKITDGLLFLACYVLQVSGGLYLALLLHVALAILSWQGLVRVPEPAAARGRGLLLAIGATCVAVSCLIFLPYARAREQLELDRSQAEVRAYGATALSYLSVSDAHGPAYPWPLRRLARGENELFPGWAALVFGTAGLLACLGRAPGRPASRRNRRLALLALGVCLLGFLVSDLHTWFDLSGRLGRSPYRRAFALTAAGAAAFLVLERAGRGRWLPLRFCPGTGLFLRGLVTTGAASFLLAYPHIYIFAREIVPGLESMRVTTRIYPYLSLAICALAAVGLDRTLKGMQSAGARRLLLALVLGGFVIEAQPHLEWPRIKLEGEFPPVYAWLAKEPAVAAIVEYPRFDDARSAMYMYYSTRHWKPIVNGFSSKPPPGHAELLPANEPLPGAETLARLREAGVTHIVVHTRERSTESWREVVAEWHRQAEARGLALRARLRGDRVYEILARGPATGSI